VIQNGKILNLKKKKKKSFNKEEISNEELDENFDIDSDINYTINEKSWIKGEI